MVRVAVFIDGRNFYASWRLAGAPPMRYDKMVEWLALQAHEDALSIGGWYYTGVGNPKQGGLSPEAEAGVVRLDRFLAELESDRGMTVVRRPRSLTSMQSCGHCGHKYAERYAEERGVDVTLATDMLTMGLTGAYDMAVLVSGDADFEPVVRALRARGKPVLVASWGSLGLARVLAAAAHDVIDLGRGVTAFGRGDATAELPSGASAGAGGGSVPDEVLFLQNLETALGAFRGGYVGVNYFVTRWRGTNFPQDAIWRRALLDHLRDAGKVEVYSTDSGEQALRLVQRAEVQAVTPED